MELIKVSCRELPGLRDLLADLGDGENGFTGTDVPSGDMPMSQYLARCVHASEAGDLPTGIVPQTIFWAVTDGIPVGMIKIRHYLNDHLLIHGGHVGYYIHSRYRRRGYGKEALRLAVLELRDMGQSRILLTVRPDNLASVGVVKANGGKYEDETQDPLTGSPIARYWISHSD